MLSIKRANLRNIFKEIKIILVGNIKNTPTNFPNKKIIKMPRRHEDTKKSQIKTFLTLRLSALAAKICGARHLSKYIKILVYSRSFNNFAVLF
jgi:hypothetical protein